MILLRGQIIYNGIDINTANEKMLLLITGKRCRLYKLCNNKYKLCKLPNNFEFLDSKTNSKVIYEHGNIKVIKECDNNCNDCNNKYKCIIPSPVGSTGAQGPAGPRGPSECGPGGTGGSGETGTRGATGYAGSTGDMGVQGPTGMFVTQV